MVLEIAYLTNKEEVNADCIVMKLMIYIYIMAAPRLRKSKISQERCAGNK